jgi:hypothetical protein
MIMWGMFSCCVVAAHTLGTMMALRFLTGAAEAFIHGTLIYLSFWYRYDELATRGALYVTLRPKVSAIKNEAPRCY